MVTKYDDDDDDDDDDDCVQQSTINQLTFRLTFWQTHGQTYRQKHIFRNQEQQPAASRL